MSKTKPEFKRMLLRLPHSRQDYAAVAIIAELARLLGADLIGTYVEDIRVRDLADLPNTREFRAGSWQPSSGQRLKLDLAIAAREAERLFRENARHPGSALTFSLAQEAFARPDDAVDDIIAVIEPQNAIERITHQFNEWLDAALGSTSSILLVPSRARRLSGPIVAVADDPDDPGVAVALALAASSGERMVLLASRASIESLGSALERARTAGVVASTADAAFHGEDLLLPAHVKGGLLIMSHHPTMRRPALSQTPILLVSLKLRAIRKLEPLPPGLPLGPGS